MVLPGRLESHEKEWGGLARGSHNVIPISTNEPMRTSVIDNLVFSSAALNFHTLTWYT